MKQIGTKIAKGVVWMLLFKVLEKSLGFISTLILARLLVPQDFGLMAMASSIIAGIELLRAFNFDVALIQKKEITKKHYNTAWSYNLSFGVLGVFLLLVSAPYAADFYQEERLRNVIYALSIGVLISSLQNTGIVDFRRNMNFRKEFKWMISQKVAGFTVTMIIVFLYQSYWALIIGGIARRSMGTLMSYTMHPYRPRVSFAASNELLSFSAWLLINNVLFFMKLRAADFIIGRISGTHALGIFSLSYEISNMPTTELVAPINRAVFPGYANIAHDQNMLQESFINVLSLIFLFSLPVGMGIAATADLSVPVLLGQKWLETIPLIKVLAFFGVVTAIQTNVGLMFLAIGKPRVLTFLALVYVIILVISLIHSVTEWGVLGAAWTYLIVSLIVAPFTYHLGLKNMNMRWSSILNIMWRPTLAVSLMYFSVYLFINYFASTSGFLDSFISLIVSILIGLIVYLSSILALWIISDKQEGAEKLVLEKLATRKVPFISYLSRLLLKQAES